MYRSKAVKETLHLVKGDIKCELFYPQTSRKKARPGFVGLKPNGLYVTSLHGWRKKQKQYQFYPFGTDTEVDHDPNLRAVIIKMGPKLTSE